MQTAGVSKSKENDLCLFNGQLNILLATNQRNESIIINALEMEGRYKNIYHFRNSADIILFLNRIKEISEMKQHCIILLDLDSSLEHDIKEVQLLKTNEHAKGIPTIIFAQNPSQTDRIQAFQNHAGGIINKSLPFEEFKKKLIDTIHYWEVAFISHHHFDVCKS